ncbi:MAG: ferritin-like domain-containing protein [Thioalkalispiraceae bacterium]
MADSPQDKVRMTMSLYDVWNDKQYIHEVADQDALESVERLLTPGRPSLPRLVSPRELPKRGAHTEEGKAALIHALAHIEFNAINLALDAVYRFRGLPSEYYSDWLRVAKEEAYHFSLLSEHLRSLGYQYGDFDAHNGLWEMALETDHDVLVRMALVPRVMEARGLDVTPSIIAKLESAGDSRMVEILKIIQHDEVGHVEIGTKWYRYFCEIRGLSPLEMFKSLLVKHLKGNIRGPYDMVMRKKAGFTDDELLFLEQVGAK